MMFTTQDDIDTRVDAMLFSMLDSSETLHTMMETYWSNLDELEIYSYKPHFLLMLLISRGAM